MKRLCNLLCLFSLFYCSSLSASLVPTTENVPPVITIADLESNSDNAEWAMDGNQISMIVEFDESLKVAPASLMSGQVAEITPSYSPCMLSYEASTIVDNNTPEGFRSNVDKNKNILKKNIED